MKPYSRKTTAEEYNAIFSKLPTDEATVASVIRDGSHAPAMIAAGVVALAKATPRLAFQGGVAAYQAMEAIAYAPVVIGQQLAAANRVKRQRQVDATLAVLGISAEEWTARREKTMFAAFSSECAATWKRNRATLKRLTGEDVGSMPDDYAASRWAALKSVRLGDRLEAIQPDPTPEAAIAETVAAIVASGAHAPAEALDTSECQGCTPEPVSALAETLATPEAITQAAVAETAALMHADADAALAKLDATVQAIGSEPTPAVIALPAVTLTDTGKPLGLIGSEPGDVTAQPTAAELVQDAAAIVTAAQETAHSVAETVQPATVAVVEPMAQQAEPTLSPATIAAQAAICDAGRAFLDKPSTPTAADYRKVAKAAMKAGHIDGPAFAKVKAETAAYVQQKRGVKGGK